MSVRSNLVIASILLLVIIFSGSVGHATIRDARPLELNSPVRGSLQNARTKNYYAIVLSFPGYVRIDFDHENLTEHYLGWIIKLYDDASQEIERFSSRWNEPETSSANIGLPPGTYYILVEAHTAANHNNADYIITANFDVTELPLDDDTAEPLADDHDDEGAMSDQELESALLPGDGLFENVSSPFVSCANPELHTVRRRLFHKVNATKIGQSEITKDNAKSLL